MIGTPLLRRAYNLGLKAVPNFEGLPAEVIAYYEQHLDQIPQALARGFVIEQAANAPAKPEDGPSRIILAGLLEEIGEPVELPVIPCFVAHEKFVVNRDGELPISGLGRNFQTNFLDVVEEPVPAATLKQRRLLKRSVDGPILAALGDADLAKIEKARVALAHVFSYLKTAARNRWYIFYVADAKGRVWAVDASWDGRGWGLEAYSVRDPNGWLAGGRVVSR